MRIDKAPLPDLNTALGAKPTLRMIVAIDHLGAPDHRSNAFSFFLFLQQIFERGYYKNISICLFFACLWSHPNGEVTRNLDGWDE